MKKFLLYLWQLPQNVLGVLVIIFTGAQKVIGEDGCWLTNVCPFGVSLGKYVIFGQRFSDTDLKHERGHQKQSLYLGWLYLLLIGLPSALGNIYDQLAHQNWLVIDRIVWYYSQPWEKWADRLGGVDRGIE